MKYFMVLVLIISSVVFAKPTEKEQKIIKDTAESIGIELSFSREVTLSNIEKKCLESFKKKSLDLEKTREIQSVATKYCVAEWKSLQ